MNATKTKVIEQEPTIWRLHIRPGGDEVRGRILWEKSLRLCQKQGVLGVGWGVNTTKRRSLTWPEYERHAKRQYGKVSSSVSLLANEVSDGDLIWVRDIFGVYFLGRVIGPWRYIGNAENYEADILNLRAVRLKRVGVESHVPGKVIASFRPSRTLQRIDDATVVNYSQYLFNKLTRTKIYKIKPLQRQIFSLLNDRDCEDVIFVYLQTRGYVAYPSQRMRDTQSYEYVLVHRRLGYEAIVQVKTGNTKFL
jgi:hypothetical protein